ncbi:MAG: hypothetical protein IKP88_02840 [Lachnospiraceae bacterium]|nr:hypothetical protein [Lachnospiraceae bacterium]
MSASKNVSVDKGLIKADFFTGLTVILFALGTILFLAVKLLGEDFKEVFCWWLMLLAAGIAFLPLTMLLMRKFRDSGWIFSKVIGVAVSGWLIWLLSSVKILKFTNLNCWITLIICFLCNFALFIFCIRKHKSDYDIFERPKDVLTHALLAEVIFLAAFVIWNYIKGFKPEAYGTTEKMMDYGFMKAMFKSDYMPPEDIWLSGHPINYYYVGQFMATYMTKLAGTGVEYGYNLTLNMLAALGFSLPCAIVFNVADNFKEKKEKFTDEIFPYIAAVISGLAVSIAGNMHYCIFNNVVPTVRTILGLDGLAESADHTFSTYWFPNATRYIGYNPETTDKTIHEFPSYSFVLGDLHAHVLNIMFVLTAIAILLGIVLNNKKRLKDAITGTYQKNEKKGIAGFAIGEIFSPSIIAVGFLIGLFHTTNYWDYPIYFVVSGAVILFVNCRLYNFSKNTLLLTLFHAVTVIVTAKITALPFTLVFNQIASQINICENHTPLYQLLILWGLPIFVTLLFLFILISEKRGYAPLADRRNEEPGKKNALYRFIANLNISDMFILILGLCAIGLVIIPELVYVKDIYSGDYKRANTMFKLSYQAFIMFGMTMGYVITKLLFYAKKTSHRVLGFILGYMLIKTFGYFDNATKAWFGDYSFVTPEGTSDKDAQFVLLCAYVVFGIIFAIEALYLLASKKKTLRHIYLSGAACLTIMAAVIILFSDFFTLNSRYKGLNSGDYLKDENMEDYLATNWINENIEGRPVLLEANGNSYTYYERVSTITGLPTILGWRTHEWLWQSTSADGSVPDVVLEREADIETIYTSEDLSETRELLDKYEVEYIYVGGCEREKFEDNINLEGLLSLGTVCYPQNFISPEETNTFIIKVGR